MTVRDHPLNLVVTESQGETRVEGFVTKAGKGVAGAMVVLLPKDTGAWRSLSRRDQSNLSDGSFALRDVAPGQYTLVAIQNGWSLGVVASGSYGALSSLRHRRHSNR